MNSRTFSSPCRKTPALFRPGAATPTRTRGAIDARRDRRASVDIVEEHGWTLERYNAVAYQVNSTDAAWQRFRALMEQRSCAGLLRSPPRDCD